MPDKSRTIGYIRVSRSKQNTDLQLDAMQAAGVSLLFKDKISGKRWHRAGLDAALCEVRSGDRFAVWRIDRLGRSVVPILTVVEDLARRGIPVISLDEHFDTSTEHGMTQCMFLAVFAHMEHSAICRRTKAGVDAAMARGKPRGGKPRMTPRQVTQARALMATGHMTAEAIATRFHVGRATLYRHLRDDISCL